MKLLKTLILAIMIFSCSAPNKSLDQQLILAVEAQDLEQVKKLLDQGANPNVKKDGKQHVLIVATQNGHGDIVTSLIQSDANPNVHERQHGKTPLIIAAEKGHHHIVGYLILNEAELNRRDHKGNTALITAVSSDAPPEVRRAIVQRLLDFGASLHIENDEGKTALEIARERGDTDIQKMIEKAAQPGLK